MEIWTGQAYSKHADDNCSPFHSQPLHNMAGVVQETLSRTAGEKYNRHEVGKLAYLLQAERKGQK